MSHRLPISFCREARESVCVSWRALPARAAGLRTSATPARDAVKSTVPEIITDPAACAESKKSRDDIKSSDNWRAVLLNGAVNHAPETAAFFFSRLGLRNGFGLAGGSSPDRMG